MKLSPQRLVAYFLLAWLGLTVKGWQPASPPTCVNPSVTLNADYEYAIGSADFISPDGGKEAGSTYAWLIDGVSSSIGAVAEGLLLNFDGAADGANGELPVRAETVAYLPSRWGQALALPNGGRLEYARQDNLYLEEGTLELWLALQQDGSAPVYGQWQVLLHYESPGGDYLQLAQSEAGALYGGGETGGNWQGAGNWNGSVHGWQAGEWHHAALTFSTSGNFIRFYLDGLRVGEAEGYQSPDADGDGLWVGGSEWEPAAYLLDSVRISGKAASDAEIAAHASRLTPPQANETWLPTEALTAGNSLVFEYTPATAEESGATCASAPLTFPGIPVFNPQPPSTLLPAGATSFELSVESLAVTSCAYAVSDPLPHAQMIPFASGAGSTQHSTLVAGLNPDPNVVNAVFVRCASQPDFLLSLYYRSLSSASPRYPRAGNLWGWWELMAHAQQDLAYLARIDLWLGADASGEQIAALRQLNPHIRVLTSINAVENNDLSVAMCQGCAGEACEAWYLHDVNGERIEVWPGSWRINLTNPEVAEYQACYAYRTVLQTGMMADGVFFDNVMTSMSWLTQDIYGNAVQIDADNDGAPDDPQSLDAAWKAGVFHELETFRQLMPYALVNGHSMSIYEPGISALANGISLGFVTADVLEDESSFSELWELYRTWEAQALPPTAVMFESSPPDQIAYGYDYEPWTKVPTSTLEFARSYYPDVRFGLALTLMGEGYFAHEFGDTWHGNDWWYDELDFDLGFPFGAAELVDLGSSGPNLIDNGGFEAESLSPWSLWADDETGCQAAVVRDSTDAAAGEASARIVITATSGVDWQIDLAQFDRALEQGARYDLTFWGKADRERMVTLSSQKGSPEWDNYGLWRQIALGSEWQPYTVTFEANTSADDARLQFFVGEVTGTVWLDEVALSLHPPDVYRRDFTRGLALLNATRQAQTIPIEPGFRRLDGSQAPAVEYIIDDDDTRFSVISGAWVTKTYDSGEWQASGPFYHAWDVSLHELTSAAGQARWDLSIAATDTYTLTVWWPDAPESIGWCSQATYELVAGGQTVFSVTLDQSTGGDEWHLIGAAPLSPGDAPYLRLTNAEDTPCAADAVHVRSQARYNNGESVTQVTLQPMDGIILRREVFYEVFLPLVRR